MFYIVCSTFEASKSNFHAKHAFSKDSRWNKPAVIQFGKLPEIFKQFSSTVSASAQRLSSVATEFDKSTVSDTETGWAAQGDSNVDSESQ